MLGDGNKTLSRTISQCLLRCVEVSAWRLYGASQPAEEMARASTWRCRSITDALGFENASYRLIRGDLKETRKPEEHLDFQVHAKDLRDPINAFHWPLHIVSAEASSPRKVNPF